MSETAKTIEKAMAILVELADGRPASPRELSDRMGVNRTIIQRLLHTLQVRGFVMREGGQFALSGQVSRIAESVQPRLREAARAPIDALTKKLGETIVLFVRDGEDAVSLVELVPSKGISLQVRREVGFRGAGGSTAAGVAQLAFSDRAAQERILRDADDPPHLSAALESARTHGFAREPEGVNTGITGLAVPIIEDGEVIGSIAVLVPSTRSGELDFVASEMLKQARRVEATLCTIPARDSGSTLHSQDIR